MTLLYVLLGLMAAGQAQASARYYCSGDWTNTVAVTGSCGWGIGGGGPGGLPGADDTVGDCVAGMGGSTVTLSTVAPLIRNFQFGRDESWYQIVNAGGVLTTTGSGGVSSSVGQIGTACMGRMTVNAGGQVIVTNVLFVGNGTHGFVTNDGGNLLITGHLWVGAQNSIKGLVRITNGGVVKVGGTIGLGTVNASTPSGGKGYVYLQDRGVLSLTTIPATNAIQPNSLMDISGSGQVIVPGDRAAVMSYYTNVGRITACGGLGTVGIDYNNTNVGKTTLYAIAPVAPPRQSITGAAVRGGNVTLTYQTTAGLFYHIESTPSLSPALWTPVAGSITNATGASVTFTFPTSGDQTFYRTVSP
jgi:hypothetical protein